MNASRRVARELRHYESAVIAARDAAGYPVSVRCTPVPIPGPAILGVAIPDALGFEPGPAWLLCHSHDARFWSLHSFGARGSLERTPEGWRFRPTSFVGGMGGIIPWIRMFLGGRRRARRYLAAHGLTAPVVPWDRVNLIKHQMAEQRRNDSRTPPA